MNFDPQKFFIGVIDFFSILLPGGLLAYFWRYYIFYCVLRTRSWELQGTENWMIFLFSAYLLGHIIFLLGSLLDEPYDWVRRFTFQNQIEKRMMAGKGPRTSFMRFLTAPARMLAKILFGKNPDKAVTIAERIKSRALASLQAENAVNTFQWCKIKLSKQNPEGLVAVHRFEADSKFFRSFAVVLMFLAVFYLSIEVRIGLVIGCVLLLPLTLWRYADQRFKATQHAYWHTLALDGMSPLLPKEAGADGRTHAGGVVFRKADGKIEYLLVASSKDRNQLVLPKGHIEWGEKEKRTAVREVHEESGCWARIIDWIADVRMGNTEKDPLVCFFLMELEQEESWPTENRPRRWLTLDAAKQQNLLAQTQQLLGDAEALRNPPKNKTPQTA